MRQWRGPRDPAVCATSWHSPQCPYQPHCPAHQLPRLELTLPPQTLHPRGMIAGAITSQYLLEKSRIVFQVGWALHGLVCWDKGRGRRGVCSDSEPGPWPGWVKVELMNKYVCKCEL